MKSFIHSTCTLILLFAFGGVMAAAEQPATLKLGSKAPSFSLPGVDGKTYQLSDFDPHNILAIIFSCNHCPTAQAYEERIKTLVKDYQSKGVGFVMISPNSPAAVNLNELGYTDLGDTLEDMKIRARDHGFNFPYLYDGDTQEASLKYGPTATPQTFIFDRKRELRYIGRLDASEKPGTANAEDVRNALDDLLAGRPVKLAKTKTFGCSTKWAWKNAWKIKTLQEWSELPVTLNDIDIEGVKSLLQNDGEKLRLINVWATWCGPCVAEFPDFITTDRMYRHRDFEFISISADKPSQKKKALKFLQSQEASNQNFIGTWKNNYDLIEAVDPDWEGALPYTILVEPGGKKIYGKQGMVDPLELRRAIVGHKLLGRYF